MKNIETVIVPKLFEKKNYFSGGWRSANVLLDSMGVPVLHQSVQFIAVRKTVKNVDW